MHGWLQANQVLLRERVNLATVELRTVDRELVIGDVEVVRVDSESRLIAEARATVTARVSRVDLIDDPRVCRIARIAVDSRAVGAVDRDVQMRRVAKRTEVAAADEQNRREPRVGRAGRSSSVDRS